MSLREPIGDSPDSSETACRIALKHLRAYFELGQAYIGREREAMEAIPGYNEAVTQAHAQARADASDTAPLLFTPEVTAGVQAVHERFAPYRAEWEAERKQVIAALTPLDESGVEAFLAKVEGNSLEMAQALSLLACSQNARAATPLIARLQREIPDEPDQYKRNHFQKFVADCVPFVRQMRRETRETRRLLYRSATIRVLERIGDCRAVLAIQPFLSDPSDKVREAARKALQAMGTDEK